VCGGKGDLSGLSIVYLNSSLIEPGHPHLAPRLKKGIVIILPPPLSAFMASYKTDFILSVYKHMQSNSGAEYHVRMHLHADMLKNLVWLCTLLCMWRED
jgi:hypothetical protein